MSTESSFVTSATELRAYAPAADPSLALPASRAAGAHARPLASRRDLRTEPGPIRFVIIALAVTFLSVFVVLPLVVVFAQAFSKGVGAYFSALAEPEALAAIRLTLLVAAISLTLILVFAVMAAWAIAEFGAVSVVSGHIRCETNTMPLLVEILYNEYQFVSSFAIASLLAMLALITLVVKTVLERRLDEGQAPRDNPSDH